MGKYAEEFIRRGLRAALWSEDQIDDALQGFRNHVAHALAEEIRSDEEFPSDVLPWIRIVADKIDPEVQSNG